MNYAHHACSQPIEGTIGLIITLKRRPEKDQQVVGDGRRTEAVMATPGSYTRDAAQEHPCGIASTRCRIGENLAKPHSQASRRERYTVR